MRGVVILRDAGGVVEGALHGTAPHGFLLVNVGLL
jgi:hypothetical protein